MTEKLLTVLVLIEGTALALHLLALRRALKAERIRDEAMGMQKEAMRRMAAADADRATLMRDRQQEVEALRFERGDREN
ncbi:MAG: hypothetical protein KA310_03285 [Pseudomonadales bacterium]|nr:hypothetical protein [Pseudomonadales bacterium]